MLMGMTAIQRNNLVLQYYDNIGTMGTQMFIKKVEQLIQFQRSLSGSAYVFDYCATLEMLINSGFQPQLSFQDTFSSSTIKKLKESLRQSQLDNREFKKLCKFRREQRKKPEPPSLYQSIAAFIRSMVSDKPQLPKDIYSLENVQKERKQRNKSLKKGFFIRSKKPMDLMKA